MHLYFDVQKRAMLCCKLVLDVTHTCGWDKKCTQVQMTNLWELPNMTVTRTLLSIKTVMTFLAHGMAVISCSKSDCLTVTAVPSICIDHTVSQPVSNCTSLDTRDLSCGCLLILDVQPAGHDLIILFKLSIWLIGFLNHIVQDAGCNNYVGFDLGRPILDPAA